MGIKDTALSALPALFVAVLGVTFAWLWIDVAKWLPFVIVALGAIVGVIADSVARRRLLPDRPVAAVRLMEWWIVTPGALAALATGGLIVLAVETAPADNWSEERKQLVSATVGAISAFLTTVLIKAAEDADSGWIAGHVKSAFYDCYKRDETGTEHQPGVRYFPPSSEGERWVYSDPYKEVEGWGRRARIVRAEGVKDALATDSAE